MFLNSLTTTYTTIIIAFAMRCAASTGVLKREKHFDVVIRRIPRRARTLQMNWMYNPNLCFLAFSCSFIS